MVTLGAHAHAGGIPGVGGRWPSPASHRWAWTRTATAMLLAVLHRRHAGVACMDRDVFVNAVGGVRISEPA